MRSYLKFVNSLELSDKGREQIMWRTTARLFKIDVSARLGKDAAGA